MISKIRNSVWFISIAVTELLVFNLCPKNNSFLSVLPALWIAPLSPLFSLILVDAVDRLQYKYFGISKRKDAAYILEQSIFANLVLTALMVVVMYTVYMHWKPLYVTMYITPWIILLAESVFLRVLFYFTPMAELMDVYKKKAFIVNKVDDIKVVSNNADDIIRRLEDIERKVEDDRKFGRKDENFYFLLDALQHKRYYLTEEEYKLIDKRINACVDISDVAMINYLEIKTRLEQYKCEAKSKQKKQCIIKLH